MPRVKAEVLVDVGPGMETMVSLEAQPEDMQEEQAE